MLERLTLAAALRKLVRLEKARCLRSELAIGA
jgi:hypothetical protein